MNQLRRTLFSTSGPFMRSVSSAIVLFATSVISLVEVEANQGSVDLPDGFIDEEVASDLESPVGLTFLPDGRILVVEQISADIAIVPVGASVATTIFTVPDVDAGGEKGLLGIAVDPEWPVRPYLYIYFDHSSGDEIHIRMYTASGDLSDPASSNLVLSSPYEIIDDIPDIFFNHNGGTIRFGPDGMLYAGTGDDAEFCNAQILTSLSGKILRLDVSALPEAGSGPPAKSVITPDDNPFPGPNENERLVYSHGLRNPFRFHIDPLTGRLYIGDVGSGDYEEVNEAFGGDNFGWPKREGAHDHPSGNGCPGTDGTDPIAEYDRSGFGASIIGDPIYRVSGVNSFPIEYDGDVFFHEYYQGFVRRVTFNEALQTWEPAAAVPGQPNAEDWATGYSGVSDMVQGPDGSLYYVHQWWNSVRRIRNENPTTSVAGLPERGFNLRTQPNPIRLGETATINYSLHAEGHVELGLYDVDGTLVSVLANEAQTSGDHVLTWRARFPDEPSQTGRVLFVRMNVAGVVQSAKVAIVP